LGIYTSEASEQKLEGPEIAMKESVKEERRPLTRIQKALKHCTGETGKISNITFENLLKIPGKCDEKNKACILCPIYDKMARLRREQAMGRFQFTRVRRSPFFTPYRDSGRLDKTEERIGKD
jgi:hypothetical protein